MRTVADDSILNETRLAVPEIIKLKEEFEEINNELSQMINYDSEVYNAKLSRLDYVTHRMEVLDASRYEELVERTLLGLGFERKDFDRNVNEFSGGWKMRVELAKILISKPEILLLDEPTNHLDIESIRWLETYLIAYRGIVVLVSHDKTFLDSICTRTIEITSQKVYDFSGSYSKFISWRDEMIESQTNAQNNQAKEVEQIKRFIERFRYKSTKAKQVQSRIKRLEKIREIEVEYKDTSSISFAFPKAPPSGKVVAEAKGLTKSYDELNVFRNLDFEIISGESVAFIGKNGEGKSTLAKIIAGDISYDGYLKIGYNVNIGYFAQNQADMLDGTKTVFETMDALAVGDMRTKTRAILGGFLFQGEDIDKKVGVLSGGERTRLAIACMLLKPFNLLIMDEPTNHLDMISKDILKHALLHYGGTMIIVSHDRDFLEGLTDKVFDFHNHTIKQYSGGIEEYLERNKMSSIDEVSLRKNSSSSVIADSEIPLASDNKTAYEEQKEADRRRRKKNRMISQYEQQIENLEQQLSEIEIAMNNPSVTEDVFIKYGALKNELDNVMEQWLECQNEKE